MAFSAKVGPCFDGDSYAFGLALFRKLNCFLVVGGDVATESIMKVSDEVVSILVIKGHESPSHHYKLHFVNVMPDLSQLFNSVPSLDVRVVASTNRTHRSRLVSSVRLS